MSQPGFYFYPGDWYKDTRVLSLQCRGAWIDLLGELNERGGSVSWSLTDYSRFWGCDLPQAQAIILELDRFKTAEIGVQSADFFRDSSGHFPGSVTLPGHATVTVMSRRLQRELKLRAEAKLRKQRERERKHVTVKSQEHVTPLSGPSSYPSPSPSPSLSSQSPTVPLKNEGKSPKTVLRSDGTNRPRELTHHEKVLQWKKDLAAEKRNGQEITPEQWAELEAKLPDRPKVEADDDIPF